MKRFDLDDIFNDSSAIGTQSLNVGPSPVTALFFAGKTPFSEYFRNSYKLDESDYQKAANKLIKQALLIKRYFDACPYIKMKSDIQTIDFNDYSKLYDEFGAGDAMFLYPYAVFSFEFDHNFKTRRECEKIVYHIHSVSLKGAYLDFFKYEPVKTFCRVNLDAGGYMPALWGKDFRNLTGKRLRRVLLTEARSTSDNLFKFFCDDRY